MNDQFVEKIELPTGNARFDVISLLRVNNEFVLDHEFIYFEGIPFFSATSRVVKVSIWDTRRSAPSAVARVSS
jgi:hypothetical protein